MLQYITTREDMISNQNVLHHLTKTLICRNERLIVNLNER
jgi:hypothetical protein